MYSINNRTYILSFRYVNTHNHQARKHHLGGAQSPRNPSTSWLPPPPQRKTAHQDCSAVNIDLNDILFQDRVATYILRVTRTSMIDAGIIVSDLVPAGIFTPSDGLTYTLMSRDVAGVLV